MKTKVWIFLIILAFLGGMVYGWSMAVATISKTAHQLLEHFGYSPDIIINECMKRYGI